MGYTQLLASSNIALSSDFYKASCLFRQYQSIVNNSIDSNSSLLLAIGNIPSSQSGSPSFSSYPTTYDVLHQFLCLLPNEYNNSADDLPKTLLKILSYQLCYPFSIIYTNILKIDICPDIWKMTHPILKKGDATKAINYRPITCYRVH